MALDGQLGLDVLLARPSDFDLVLLDIVMPGLDGIEVRVRTCVKRTYTSLILCG